MGLLERARRRLRRRGRAPELTLPSGGGRALVVRGRGVPPEPPPGLPEGRAVAVPGVGELFVRDTGGSGPAVLLLHGWLFPADTNWHTVYGPLADAGYRAIALDHRGHGRGLRAEAPFRLTDCAADAAALVRHLGCGPVTAVGYSMGGPVAALMARDHPDTVSALVMCATALEWDDPNQKAFLAGMVGLKMSLSLFPRPMFRWAMRRSGVRDERMSAWLAAELARGSARDLAEAGREIGRYEASSWIGSLAAPSAVVLTTRDQSVPPRKQRTLASALGARVLEVEGSHFAVTESPERFVPVLLDAVGGMAPGVVRAA